MSWLSPKSIAKKLDMSSKTVLRMLDRKQLPSVTLPSGRKRVSEQALERFLRNLEKRQARTHHPSTCGDDACLNSDSGNELPAVQSGNHGRKSA